MNVLSRAKMTSLKLTARVIKLGLYSPIRDSATNVTSVLMSEVLNV